MRKLIFDTHAHYDDKAYDEDRDKLLMDMYEGGVCNIVNVGFDEQTSKNSIELSEKYPFIYAAVGVHPHEVSKASKNYLDVIKSFVQNEKVVAIGEIGLDYHYDLSPRDEQKIAFEDQLKLAKELDVPVIIHNREAHEDTLNLLKKYKPKGVVHCFSGSEEISREILKLGMYIGLGGAVTFKNAKNPILVAKSVPLDRLVLETDAPYMAPVPFRGKRCNSSMIMETAKVIAGVRGMDVEDLLESTKENAQKLFNI